MARINRACRVFRASHDPVGLGQHRGLNDGDCGVAQRTLALGYSETHRDKRSRDPARHPRCRPYRIRPGHRGNRPDDSHGRGDLYLEI